MCQKIVFICGKLLVIAAICSVFGMCRYAVPIDMAWGDTFVSDNLPEKAH